MAKDNLLFSVIIVNWNTKELTLEAIASIFNTGENRLEVIVVDNASQDGSVAAIREKYPTVKLYVNAENLGFSKANNIGLHNARGEFAVLLNSDAELKSLDAFAQLENVFQGHPDLGILGGKLIKPNGELESLGRTFLSLEELVKMQLFFRMGFRRQDDTGKRKIVPVDYVSGAFLAIRKKTFQEIGLLNEAFFMYGEDMEWCARARQFSWDVAVLPDVVVMHHHAASSVKNFKKILVENALNTCRFMWWRYGARDAKIAFDIYMIGMLLRIPLSIMRRNGLGGDYASALLQCLKLRPTLKQELSSK